MEITSHNIFTEFNYRQLKFAVARIFIVEFKKIQSVFEIHLNRIFIVQLQAWIIWSSNHFAYHISSPYDNNFGMSFFFVTSSENRMSQ